MKKLKSKISVIILIMIAVIFSLSVISRAEKVTTIASWGYDTLIGYSASDIDDLQVLDENPRRQMHAQTLCTHKASGTGVGSYTAVRLVVDIEGNNASAINVSTGAVTNLGSSSLYAKVGFVAAVAEAKGYVGSIGSGNNDDTNLYQLAYRYLYESGGFRSTLESKTGVSLVNDSSNGANNNLVAQATEYANNGATLTDGNVDFIEDETGEDVEVGQTAKARILITGAEYNQALNILTGIFDGEITIDVGVTKEITRSSPGIEIGEEANFKITVTNYSDYEVTMTLKDEYDTSFYSYVSFTGNRVSPSHSNGKITATITVPARDSYEYSANFTAKDSATPNEKCYNNVEIYNFKVNGNDIEDTDPSNNDDSDFYYVKDYDAGINKYIYNVGSTSYSSRRTNKSATVYAETGDEVVYAIELKNNGSSTSKYGNVKNIKFTDTFPSELTDIKYYNGSSYVTSLPSGWSKSGNTFTYTGSLSAGSSDTLYVRGKLTKQYDSVGNTVTNTAEIIEFKNKNNKIIFGSAKIADCNPVRSSDTFTVKAYKVNITKDVDKAYVETGDTVTYTIKVKNSGSGNQYGAIKGISIKDTYNSSELEYVSMTGTGWSKTGDTFSYSNSLGVGKEATLTLKFTVKKMSKTNDTIINTATLLSVVNKHNYVFYDNDTELMVSGSTFEDSAESILKIYTLDVTKTVNAVYDKSGKKLSFTDECEIGDTVEFKIDVKNSGDDANYDGSLYEININDYFDNKYFSYDSVTGTGWSKTSGATANGNKSTITLKYTNSKGLGIGQTATFYVKLKVREDINPNDLTQDVEITNTAEIKTNDAVKNKNSIDIRSVLNGRLKDSASLTLRSYETKVNKYITKLNGSPIGGRDGMSVAARNNKPVEVEKYDVLVYTLRIENPAGAALHNMTITDTLEDGLEFTSATSSVKSAKKYSASNTSGSNITVTESSATSGSKNINYSGVINAGEYILIEVECKVVKTNMYLLNLVNTLDITEVYNRNSVEILRYLQYEGKENKDYVRLKNLIISGTVWLEDQTAEDGLIASGEKKLEGIKVTLRDVTNGKYAVTYTDSNGYYIFESEEPIYGTKNNGSKDSAIMIEGGANKGRVIKGTNRNDETGNYSTSSNHIEYYVEFEYNGVRFEPTVYSNKNNLNSDFSYKSDYEIDSNAIEFTEERDTLNRKLETVAYNKGIHASGSKVTLEYDKDAHESELLLNDATKINAYSFVINPDAKLIENLFLSDEGETEYLKYINLGLIEREHLDVRITKDLVESNVYINGYEMKYHFNKLNHDTALYFRDTDNNEEPDKYEMSVYRTDHAYRYDMYEYEAVRNAKGLASELVVDLKYKIVVHNDSKDETYVRVNEIIDTYTNEMTLTEIALNGDADALNVSDTSSYNNTSDYAFTGYRTNFITGMDTIMLEKGDTFTIDLTYTIDKDSNRSMYIFDSYADKVNVAQIGAYSTYEADRSTPKGLVDSDSNVGNLRNVSTKDDDDSYNLNDFTEYEDTAFRVDTDVVPKDDERKVEGFVFEDTRSEKLNSMKYYTGDGKFDDSVTINTEVIAHYDTEGMLRFTKADVKTKIGFNGINSQFKIALNDSDLVQDYDKDRKLADMTVELIEIITVDGKIYEETIDVLNRGNVIVRTSTTDQGKYTLSGFIPATYVVRFKHGDIFKDNTMSYNSLTHNGQDYKSTTYLLKDNAGHILENSADNDDKYEELTQSGFSDARGNELRRLEIMAFSEIMTNERAEALKYINYLNQDGTINMAKVQEFANKTAYFADTVTVSLGVENKTDTIDSIGREVAYNDNLSALKLLMPNIDYGMVYRPENFLKLRKTIKSIKLTLASETEPLVYIEYNDDGTVNTSASKGTHNVQSINTQGTVQGFRYINVDEDILQGAKLETVYKMVVRNVGESDVITNELKNKGGASKVMEDLNAGRRDVVTLKLSESSGETRENYSNAATLIETVYNPLTYKYGLFVGDVYYRGALGNTTDLDVVSITVNKILDFIDNDATFIQDNNSKKDQFWATTTEEILLDPNLKLIKEESLGPNGYFLDEMYRQYTSDGKNNLVINVDSANENGNLVKAIIPKVTVANPDTNTDPYQAWITIQADSILGGDTESDTMVYENIAEIVQFTSPVGRRTNFAGTIGNMEVSGNVEPFKSAKEEPDSDGTEVIRLTPPTGLSRTQLFIMGNINTFLIIITVAIAIGMIYVTKTVLYGRVGKSKFYK